MAFPDYFALKRFVWGQYDPLPEEIAPPEQGFAAGTNFARRHSPRFFRGLRAIQEHMRPGATLLDIGSYPGSFPRLVRACYGDSMKILACGMPGTHQFQGGLAREGIEFQACNLDPEVYSKVELPKGMSLEDVPRGLPYPSGSIDIITCTEVVEHLFSLRTLIMECQRVLAPGGILYITTNNVMDRVGLLRIFCSQDTNLDNQIDQTTIWSQESSPWRGHVRFYSAKLLAEVGARAGLAVRRVSYFQQHEDPDVILWPDHGLLTPLRRRLRRRGEAPPVNLKVLTLSLLHLGLRSLAHRFDSHLEIVFELSVK
jgi:SAM-dependent methyltransferase